MTELLKGNCGVVGYHVRFTRERPPVRTRAVAFLFLSTYLLIIKIYRKSLLLLLHQERMIETGTCCQSTSIFPFKKHSNKIIQLLVFSIAFFEGQSLLHMLEYSVPNLIIFVHFLFLVQSLSLNS